MIIQCPHCGGILDIEAELGSDSAPCDCGALVEIDEDTGEVYIVSIEETGEETD
jgi:hypothetical protein